MASNSNFESLPIELQLMIWNAALQQPQAHPVELLIHENVNMVSHQGPNGGYPFMQSIWSHRFSLRRSCHLDEAGRDTIASLLPTVVLREVDELAEAAVSIYRAQPLALPYTIQGMPMMGNLYTVRVQPALPTLLIDAARDLLMLQPGWRDKISQIADISTGQPLTQQPRHLGISWHPGSVDWIGNGGELMQLLEAFHELQTLYIIVEPQTLAAIRGEWTPAGLETKMQWRRDRNMHGCPPRQTFSAGGRNYRTLSEEEVEQYGRLQDPLDYFWKLWEPMRIVRVIAAYLNSGGRLQGVDQPMKIEFMTWERQ